MNKVLLMCVCVCALQVKAFGPGLQPTGVIVNKPAEFTIDARQAGNGELKIYAQVRNHTRNIRN